MGQGARTTTEFKVLSAFALFIVIIVASVVGYDIYLHPPDPEVVGTATIKISGTSHFQGEVGTEAITHTLSKVRDLLRLRSLTDGLITS